MHVSRCYSIFDIFSNPKFVALNGSRHPHWFGVQNNEAQVWQPAHHGNFGRHLHASLGKRYVERKRVLSFVLHTLHASAPTEVLTVQRTNQDTSVSLPFIVGVAGGTASGKTSVCKKIAEGLQKGLSDNDDESFVLITQDSFYKDLTAIEAESLATYNFDHPDAFAFDEMVRCLSALRSGRSVDIPVYDYKTNARKKETTRVPQADVVLFDGILAFHSKELTSLMDLKIFVDVDSDVRLARRIRRDIAERGRDVTQILDQYETTVKPSHDIFIHPTRREADVIIPRGSENQPAIDLIIQMLKTKIAARM